MIFIAVNQKSTVLGLLHWKAIFRRDRTMLPPSIPKNEDERIRILHRLLILDSPPEERFDAITAYCHTRFQVDIVLICLVDTDRQWFKSSWGLDVKETSRDISFCGHTILSDQVLEIRNAIEDPRFTDNPLVVGAPHIRFYAGAPLIHSSGHRLGTLCLIHRQPKHLPSEELEHLKTLARTVSLELEKHQGRNCPPADA